jgi:hypothetical protein
MLDDIVVMERSIGKDRGTCTLCGFPYPAGVLLLRAGPPGDGVRSEHAYVCPACDHLLRKGEEPELPLDETVHVERAKAMHSALFESAADDGWSRLDYPGWDEEQTIGPT